MPPTHPPPLKQPQSEIHLSQAFPTPRIAFPTAIPSSPFHLMPIIDVNAPSLGLPPPSRRVPKQLRRRPPPRRLHTVNDHHLLRNRPRRNSIPTRRFPPFRGRGTSRHHRLSNQSPPGNRGIMHIRQLRRSAELHRRPPPRPRRFPPRKLFPIEQKTPAGSPRLLRTPRPKDDHSRPFRPNRPHLRPLRRRDRRNGILPFHRLQHRRRHSMGNAPIPRRLLLRSDPRHQKSFRGCRPCDRLHLRATDAPTRTAIPPRRSTRRNRLALYPFNHRVHFDRFKIQTVAMESTRVAINCPSLEIDESCK